jgi:hypothetical protein
MSPERKHLYIFLKQCLDPIETFRSVLCSVNKVKLVVVLVSEIYTHSPLNRDLECRRSGATATPSPTFTFSPPLQVGSGSLDFISWLLSHNAFHTLSRAKELEGEANSGHCTLRLNFCQERTFRH